MGVAADLLSALEARGFVLTAAAARLDVSPASALADEDRAAIRAHKPALLALLAARPGCGQCQPAGDSEPYREAHRPRTAAELVATLPQAPCRGGCGASTPYGWECASCRTATQAPKPSMTQGQSSVVGYVLNVSQRPSVPRHPTEPCAAGHRDEWEFARTDPDRAESPWYAYICRACWPADRFGCWLPSDAYPALSRPAVADVRHGCDASTIENTLNRERLERTRTLDERDTRQTNDGQVSMDLVTTHTASAARAPQVEADGLWYPRARLLQGLSPEVGNGDGRPGMWHIEGHGAMPSIVIVPLEERLSRRLTEGEGDDVLTLCFSDNGLMGLGDPGGECADCLMAQWTSDPQTGKRKPPACVLTRAWLSFAPSIQLPVRVDFKRTSEKAAQQIRTFVRMSGAGYVGVELGSEQKVSSGGFKFYTPSVKKVTVPAEDLAMARRLLSTPAPATDQLADEDVPF